MSDGNQKVNYMAFTDEMTRALFHEFYALRNLPPTVSVVFQQISLFVEEMDLEEVGREVDEDQPLPARYYHPDSLRSHYENHTEEAEDCACHPDDRSECDVCQTYVLLLAFETSEPIDGKNA